jgi:hypothetical protein
MKVKKIINILDIINNVFVYFRILILSLHIKSKSKGKAIPLQALTGPEGSRRLRLPDFKTIGT